MAGTSYSSGSSPTAGPYGDLELSQTKPLSGQAGSFGASIQTYNPKYMTPSGSLMAPSPLNAAGLTPYDALSQGKQLLQSGGPGSEMTVGPGGEIQTTLKGADPFASRLAELSKYTQQFSGGTGAGTSEPAHVQGNSMEGNEAAARAAAFARGKDQAALIAQKGLEGVKNLMASRGIGGSTLEGDGIMDVFSGATNTLGKLSSEIAMADAARAGQLSDRNYAGDVTQRGQDIDYRLGMEDAANRRNQSYLSLINSVGAY